MLKVLFMLLFMGLGALFVWRGVIRGKRYTWLFSLTRSVSVVLSVILAALISMLVAWLISGLVYMIVENLGVLSLLEDMLNELPSTMGILRAVIAMILAPCLFYGFFFGFRALFNWIAVVVTRAIVKGAKMKTLSERGLRRAMVAEKKRGKVRKYKELWVKRPNTAGKILGGVCGFFLFVAVMSPVVGFLNVGNAVLGVAAPFMKDNVAITVASDVVDAASENLGCRIIRFSGGKAIFSALTTYRTDVHKVSLQKEADFLSSLGSAVRLVNDESVSDREAADGLRKASEAFNDTTLVPAVVPEFMSAANARWSKGTHYYGIEQIKLGGSLEAFNDSLNNLLATSNYETMKTDVTLVLNLFANAVENGALRGENKGMAFLTNEALITSMMTEMVSNPHTASMISDLMEYGLELLGNKIGMNIDGKAVSDSGDPNALYNEVIKDSFGVVKSVHEQYSQKPQQDAFIQDVSKGYIEIFSEKGISISQETADALATTTYDLYKNSEVFSYDSLREMYSSHTLILEDGSSYRVEKGMVLPTSVSVERASLKDLALSSTLPPVYDASEEGALLGKAFCGVVKIANSVMDGEFMAAACVRDMGPILDCLAQSKMVGKQNTAILLTCVMQSERVYNEVGFSLAEATELVTYINQNVGTVNEDGTVNTYEVMLRTVANAIHVVQISSTGETTFAENMNFLMKDMNDVTSKLLSMLMSTSVIKKHGVSSMSANATSGMLSNLFADLAAARKAGMDDLTYEAETNAAVSLTNMMLKMNQSEAKGMFGKGSVTGTDASTVVGNILQSEVVSETVREAAFPDGATTPVSNPLNQTIVMTEEETSQLEAAMNQNWSSLSLQEKNDPEVKQTYQAIGAMFGKTVYCNNPSQITLG